MNRLIKIAVFAGLVALFSAAANAQALNNYGTLSSQNSATSPTWLNYETHNGLYTALDGRLFTGTSSASSVNLGAGLSVGMFSAFSNNPGSELSTLSVDRLALAPANGLYGAGSYLNPSAPLTSSFGGQVSMDLGKGLSLNVVGGFTRSPNASFYGDPFYMTSGERVSSSVGAGMSMDLGHGSSLSITGGVSKSSTGGTGP